MRRPAIRQLIAKKEKALRALQLASFRLHAAQRARSKARQAFDRALMAVARESERREFERAQ